MAMLPEQFAQIIRKHWELLVFAKSPYYACPPMKKLLKVQGLTIQKYVTILEDEDIY